MKELFAKFIFSALRNLFQAQPNLSKFVPQNARESSTSVAGYYGGRVPHLLRFLRFFAAKESATSAVNAFLFPA
jgi:hypothetical protein